MVARHLIAGVYIDLAEADYREIAWELKGGPEHVEVQGSAKTGVPDDRPKEPREGNMSHSDATVKDIMTKDVSTLGRNDTLDSGYDIMTLGRIRHLPVLDEGRVVGVVSQRDLFRWPSLLRWDMEKKAQKRRLRTIRVKEVMRVSPRLRSRLRLPPRRRSA